jgi:hypothetical protein
MAGKNNTAKDYFAPKNPEKYKGKLPIIYRSSWELAAMRFYDEHPYVLAWQSETVQIRYMHPIKKTPSVYIPDFIVMYENGKGKIFREMVEIKPLKETPGYQKISEKTGRPLKVNITTQMQQAINQAKWAAATAYCRAHGLTFRVVTEQTLFAMNMPK